MKLKNLLKKLAKNQLLKRKKKKERKTRIRVKSQMREMVELQTDTVGNKLSKKSLFTLKFRRV